MRFRFKRREDNPSDKQVSEDVVLDNGEKIEEVLGPDAVANDYDILDGKDLTTENDGITTTDVLGDWKPGDGVMSAKNVYATGAKTPVQRRLPKPRKPDLTFEEELQQEIEEQKKKKRKRRNRRAWPRYGMFIPFPPPRPWPPQPPPPGPGPQPPPPGPGPEPGPEPGPAPAGGEGGGGMAGGEAPAGDGMGESVAKAGYKYAVVTTLHDPTYRARSNWTVDDIYFVGNSEEECLDFISSRGYNTFLDIDGNKSPAIIMFDPKKAPKTMDFLKHRFPTMASVYWDEEDCFYENPPSSINATYDQKARKWVIDPDEPLQPKEPHKAYR